MTTLNTIPQIVSAIRELQEKVKALESQPQTPQTPVVENTAPTDEAHTTRRGRPRKTENE